MIPTLLLLAQIVPLPETAGWSYFPQSLSALENPAPPLVIITPGLPLYVPAPWCDGCPVIVYSPRPLTLDDLRLVPWDRPEQDLVDAKLFEWTDADGCLHDVNRVTTHWQAYNYVVRLCPVKP